MIIYVLSSYFIRGFRLLAGFEKLKMASNHKFALHITNIKRVLSSDVDEDLLLEDFHTLVNRFHVPVEEAKRSIIKKWSSSARRPARRRARGKRHRPRFKRENAAGTY